MFLIVFQDFTIVSLPVNRYMFQSISIDIFEEEICHVIIKMFIRTVLFVYANLMHHSTCFSYHLEQNVITAAM